MIMTDGPGSAIAFRNSDTSDIKDQSLLDTDTSSAALSPKKQSYNRGVNVVDSSETEPDGHPLALLVREAVKTYNDDNDSAGGSNEGSDGSLNTLAKTDSATDCGDSTGLQKRKGINNTPHHARSRSYEDSEQEYSEENVELYRGDDGNLVDGGFTRPHRYSTSSSVGNNSNTDNKAHTKARTRTAVIGSTSHHSKRKSMPMSASLSASNSSFGPASPVNTRHASYTLGHSGTSGQSGSGGSSRNNKLTHLHTSSSLPHPNSSSQSRASHSSTLSSSGLRKVSGNSLHASSSRRSQTINPPFQGDTNHYGYTQPYSHTSHGSSNSGEAEPEPEQNSNTWVSMPIIASVVLGNGTLLDFVLFVLTLAWLYYLITKPEKLYSSVRAGKAAIRNTRNEDDVSDDVRALTSLERRAIFFGFISPFAGGATVHVLQGLSNGPCMHILKPHVFVFIALLRPFLLMFSDWNIEADGLIRRALQEKSSGLDDIRMMKESINKVYRESKAQRAEMSEILSSLDMMKHHTDMQEDTIYRLATQQRKLQRALGEEQQQQQRVLLRRHSEMDNETNNGMHGTESSQSEYAGITDDGHEHRNSGMFGPDSITGDKLVEDVDSGYKTGKVSVSSGDVEREESVHWLMGSLGLGPGEDSSMTLLSLFSIEWPSVKAWKIVRWVYSQYTKPSRPAITAA
ncbi:hypothetical protein SARC_08208 [Sphaeroforma arctica JP610]|uniref:Uncharacterized protein n=1 Tax=Sphaeroforma arctica JP610 TaxID=667725 RepID=A0A0L0FS17_9EUKA|nr:hypothetical protein SARC_08208 [Sphaeroforma arctica JP610]KNC79396.1 hypothetical protein SARC_08208 [Sphaeroforma arctica JP610]|eukprot:XP_014153298.1 hypothetical protein SARC_08208 [Sphaeroforma arctica JP610]